MEIQKLVQKLAYSRGPHTLRTGRFPGMEWSHPYREKRDHGFYSDSDRFSAFFPFPLER